MGKDAPKAPDPYKVSAAQTKSNIETAKEQAKLGMTGQETPFGTVDYVADPTSPSGYRAVSKLSDAQQGLLDQSTALESQLGTIKGGQLDRVSAALSQPFDLDAARGKQISDIQQTFLDPQWDQRATALETSLLNRGIRPGSEAYDNAMRQFNNQRSSSYDQMFLDAFNTANNAAVQQHQMPLTDLNMLGGGSMAQPQSPQANIPTPGVAPTDVSGNVNSAYNAQVSQANNQMSGLYGLGSAALGGWASKGFPGLSTAIAALPLISDPRLKQDVLRIGTDPRGWGVYVFRYLDGVDDGDWRVGYMADEIERVRPDAVMRHPLGFKMVDYGALSDEKTRLNGYTPRDVSHAPSKTQKKRASARSKTSVDVNSKTW